MGKKESVKNAIQSVASKYSAQSRLFLAADCKPKQLKNAVSSFAHGCVMEDAVVLIDETFMDSGKKGYLFSTQCLYADGSQMKYKNPPKTGGISMPLRYEELDDVGKAMPDSTQNDSFSLRFKSGESITVVCKYAQLVSEILWEVLQVLKQEEAAGVSSVSPEEKQPEEVRTAPEKHSVQEMLDLGAACNRQKDFEGAVRWYEAALESGELQEEAVPALQNMCGMLCCVEDNPNPQIEKALFWFEKAARGGHVRAQYQCGVMYVNGQGTKQDLKKALEYLELAAAQGLKEAKAAVPQLKAMLASAPKAEPPKPDAQEELPPDEAYARGMELYRAKQYEQAIPYLELACADKDGDSYQDARIAWGWILENIYDNKTGAFQQYYIAGKKGCVPGREASVRLLASGLKTSKHLFMMRQHLASALEWARELAASGSRSASEYVPVLERLYEGMQQKKKSADQNRQREEAFKAGVAAHKNKDYAEALRWYLKAAEQGDAAAQFNCGLMYYVGEGTEKDKARALYWFEKAAEQGDAAAQRNCGLMYSGGEGTEEDKARALYWFEKAAEQGDVKAQHNCGFMYDKGEGTAQDKTEALRWYLKAAEQGDAAAQHTCGLMYYGGEGTAQDKTEALRWYLKAAEQGDAAAQYKCGLMYSIGEGTAQDTDEALRWYLKAAEQGDAKAQWKCGLLYYIDEDKAEALRWYLKAAEQGNINAQTICGNMYDDGEGTKEDKVEALRWYLKAAEQGHANAQYNCGLMHYWGQGTEEDKVEALRWYLKAAEQGDADAQYKCGLMYYGGEGTEEDKVEALRWYLKAAEQGHADAQFYCGWMYDKGEGTKEDKARGLYWYEKFAEQGDVTAQFKCGLMYYDGEGTAVDKTKSKMWFQRAAEQGHKDAAKILREYF